MYLFKTTRQTEKCLQHHFALWMDENKVVFLMMMSQHRYFMYDNPLHVNNCKGNSNGLAKGTFIVLRAKMVWVSALAGVMLTFSWVSHMSLSVLLSTKEYYWVSANCRKPDKRGPCDELHCTVKSHLGIYCFF